MSKPLPPEREAEIRNGRYTVRSNAAADIDIDDLLTELARVRAELTSAVEDTAALHRTTIPNLRRNAEHHEAGKRRWRDRAEKAEAELRDLKRDAVEAERRKIRDGLRAQIHEIGDGWFWSRRATALWDELDAHETQWAAEDAGRAE